jgi:uncharacterized membrane protein
MKANYFIRRQKMDEEEKKNEVGEKVDIDTDMDIPVPLGIACMLAYFVPVIGGVFFLFAEKRNKLLRFHSVQSILFWIFFGVAFEIAVIISWIPFLDELVALVQVVLWIYVMYQAMQKRVCKLPIIGAIASRNIYEN